MDYSLLLAVERITDSKAKAESDLNESQELIEARNRHRYFSTCGNYVYHIAIIDYLTQFNFNKRVESFYKVNLKNQDMKKVSCVNYDIYGDRFLEFMIKEVFINEDLRREIDMKID